MCRFGGKVERMGWLRDRASLLWESSAHKKMLLTLAGAACLFLGTVDQLKIAAQKAVSYWITFPQNAGPPVIFGFPSWILGLTLAFFIFAIWMLEVAAHYRKKLLPKIGVSFNRTGEGIVRTKTVVVEQDVTGAIKRRDDEAVYIRITLSAVSQITVRGCVAFLTEIEKKLIPTGPFIKIPVAGGIPITQTPIDVHPRVPTSVDFLKSGRSDNKLEFSMAWPLRLLGALDDNATYRFTIEVNGDGITETIRVDIDWAGKWDTVTGHQV
jgi:hypothetical protein